MNVITVSQLATMAGVKQNENMASVANALNSYGQKFGLDRPHRLAHFLAQMLHESGRFRYDQEIASGAAYEGRKDLGNTQPGDGKKFKGRTGGQITGRFNYTKFRDWCTAEGFRPPDFVAHPELLNTDPWEGLGFIWYWARGNPTGRSLNAYADENNIEQITKKVNGGTNGLADRLAMYTRAALVLLGYGPTEIVKFQSWAQRDKLLPADEAGKPPQVDGDAGPMTRAALHLALARLANAEVTAGPVVEVQTETVEVEKPVVVSGSDKRSWVWPAGLSALGAQLLTSFIDMPWQAKLAVAGVGIAAIVAFIFAGELIVRRVKAVIREAQV